MHLRRILAAVALALSSAACDEKLSNLAGPTPDLEPTFTSIQRDIFEQTDSSGRPACMTCHTNVGRAPFANLNLTHDVAYDQLVNVPSSERPGLLRVAPGNSDASYIVHKIEGLPDIIGVRMPRGGPYLTDGQILILRRWIDLGAPRN
jgi:hypothetical protein